MNICTIRLDDITPDMNWNNFEIIKSIFDKYNFKPLIGIVPDNQDSMLKVDKENDEFWKYMLHLQEEGWMIAQHGYQHTYVTKDSGLLGLKRASEFAGVSLQEQIEKIKKGKKILQKNGICATIFMAPGHTYDVNTLKALKQNGFTHVTDGYCKCPYEYQGLCFIPCTLSEPKLPIGIDTICFHINHMKELDFNKLDKFFEQHIGIIKNFSEILNTSEYMKKTIFLSFNEKKNLLIRKIKKSIGLNPVMQDYFAKTNSKSVKKKMLKRIIGLPILGTKLLFRRK